MVKPALKSLRPAAYGAICSALFVAFSLFELAHALRRGDDEPLLILAFFGFPVSWFMFSVFHPLLEWLGPPGFASRRAGEWIVLGFSGAVQYWIIGTFVAYLVAGGGGQNNEK